jgi:hypothetical protein
MSLVLSWVNRVTCRPRLHICSVQLRSATIFEAHYNLGVALWYSGSKEKSVLRLKESVRQSSRRGESVPFWEPLSVKLVIWQRRN